MKQTFSVQELNMLLRCQLKHYNEWNILVGKSTFFFEKYFLWKVLPSSDYESSPSLSAAL